MDWLWLILCALGGVVAFYAITAGVILIHGWRGSPVEMPGGETDDTRAASQALAYHR